MKNFTLLLTAVLFFALATKAQTINEEVEEEIFFIVETMPKFPGQGSDPFSIYIQQNIKYPIVAQEKGVSGKVFVRFVINTKGKVANVSVIRRS